MTDTQIIARGILVCLGLLLVYWTGFWAGGRNENGDMKAAVIFLLAFGMLPAIVLLLAVIKLVFSAL